VRFIADFAQKSIIRLSLSIGLEPKNLADRSLRVPSPTDQGQLQPQRTQSCFGGAYLPGAAVDDHQVWQTHFFLDQALVPSSHHLVD